MRTTDHCTTCNRPWSDTVRKVPRRTVCVECFRKEEGGLFRRGERNGEARDLALYTGKAMFDRRLRILRYCECVANHRPIQFERMERTA